MLCDLLSFVPNVSDSVFVSLEVVVVPSVVLFCGINEFNVFTANCPPKNPAADAIICPVASETPAKTAPAVGKTEVSTSDFRKC